MAHVRSSETTLKPIDERGDDPWGLRDAPWTLGRIWRLFGTGFSFALFGLAGLFMALFYFPLINLFVWNAKKREAICQWSVHAAWRLYIDIMRGLGVLTYEIHGEDILREARGAVVVANHPSLIDVVMLMSFMRRTRAVVKKGVWKNPFMAGVVRGANYIPNLGDADKLIADCADALKTGYNLCIFPEGSRTPEDEKRRYQRGFAYVAMEANAKVIVCTIKVEPPTLRKGEKWRSIPLKRPHWTIRVHDCIDTGPGYGYERSVRNVRRLAKDVEAIIEGEIRTWTHSNQN